MPRTGKFWEESPFQELAESASFRNPGMYLIALREHLSKGGKAIGDFVESVAGALPNPPGFLQSEKAEEEARAFFSNGLESK